MFSGNTINQRPEYKGMGVLISYGLHYIRYMSLREQDESFGFGGKVQYNLNTTQSQRHSVYPVWKNRIQIRLRNKRVLFSGPTYLNFV